jgi:outer membrane protein TolC
VARAAFFPRITLTGAFGNASSELNKLFTGDTRVWSFTPGVTVPIFQGGSLKANLEATKAQRDIAQANYEKSIQGGFRDVADALAQLDGTKAQLTALDEMVAASAESLRLAQARYDAGRGDYLSVLDAQRSYYAAETARLGASQQQRASLIGLYKALGGSIHVSK